MSDEQNTFDRRYIMAWTVASIVLGLILLGMFVFGNPLLHAGHAVWSLLRWICRPII